MSEIVPATREMIERASGAKLCRSARALAVVDGDRVLGVAGLLLEQDHFVMFANATEPMREHKRTVIRVYRRLLEWCSARGLPVVAQADPRIEGAQLLLEHLGFRRIPGGVYLWSGRA